MSSAYMGDLSGILGASATGRTPTHNTKKSSVDLDMTDFLTLMVTQLQNQSIDETADTSDMLNQMVQMQMITALTNMTDASVMSYASSLVGKEVTVVTYDGSEAVEKVVEIMGTGTYDGQQVVFSKEGDMYYLNEIMAVGRMPEKVEEPAEGGAATERPDETTEGAEGVDGDNAKLPDEGAESVDGDSAKLPDDRPAEETGTAEQGFTEQDGVKYWGRVDAASAGETVI